jgi:hypothetical protein
MLINAVDGREVHEHKVICMVPCEGSEAVGRIEIVRCSQTDCKESMW